MDTNFLFGASAAAIAAAKAAEVDTAAARKGGLSALVAVVESNLQGVIALPEGYAFQHGSAKVLSDILIKGGVTAATAKRLGENTIRIAAWLVAMPQDTRLGVWEAAKAAEKITSAAALMAACGGKDASAKKAAEKKAEKEAAEADSIAAECRREDELSAALKGAFIGGILAAPIAAYCQWGAAEVIPARVAAAAAKAAKEKAAAAAAKAAEEKAAAAAAAKAAKAEKAAAAAAQKAAEEDFKAVEAALKAAPASKALKIALEAARAAQNAARAAAAAAAKAA